MALRKADSFKILEHKNSDPGLKLIFTEIVLSVIYACMFSFSYNEQLKNHGHFLKALEGIFFTVCFIVFIGSPTAGIYVIF